MDNQNIFDSENEGSSISVTARTSILDIAVPQKLPPKQLGHPLGPSATMQQYLADLYNIEKLNIKKYELLKIERARKDSKIAWTRAVQDEEIQAVIIARVRRDVQILEQREREDSTYHHLLERLEEERIVGLAVCMAKSN